MDNATNAKLINTIPSMENIKKTYLYCLTLTITLGSFNFASSIGMLNGLRNLYIYKFHWETTPEYMDNYWFIATSILFAGAILTTFFGSQLT